MSETRRSMDKLDPEKRVRPTCRNCGYQDEATFTIRQLDTCDFRCPRCDSIRFDFPLLSPEDSA